MHHFVDSLATHHELGQRRERDIDVVFDAVGQQRSVAAPFATARRDVPVCFAAAKAVPLRPYQRRIADQVIAARSAVVLLRTGAGKTIIAAAYLQHFFLTSARETQPQTQRLQAIFVVPTVPLIEQQLKALRPYLPSRVVLIRVQGGRKVTLAPPSQPALYVGVAEAIRQLLSDDARADGRLVSNLGAVVLDEVHHAHDNHPYNKILDVVAGSLPGGVPCRDIIATLGLTASICNAKMPDPIRKCIAKLLVQLGAEAEDIYNATDEELGRDGCVLPPPPTELEINVSGLSLTNFASQAPLLSLTQAAKTNTGNVLPFTVALFDAIMTFEALIQTERPHFPMTITDLWHSEVAVSESKMVTDLAPYLGSAYTGRGLCRLMTALRLVAVSGQVGADTAWVYLSLFRADVEAASVRHPELAPVVQRVLDYPSFELTPLSGALMTGRAPVALPRRYAALAESVWTYCFAPTTAGAGLKRRAIVFVREVVSAHSIEGFLNAVFTPRGEAPLVRMFVSKNADAPSPLERKMPPTVAEEVLHQFRYGNVRVIVATTVAEEGLDVPSCSAVIHFERPANAIAFAQRTGRARAAGSVAVIMDGTVAEHQRSLEFQRQVVADTPKLAAAMSDLTRARDSRDDFSQYLRYFA